MPAVSPWCCPTVGLDDVGGFAETGAQAFDVGVHGSVVAVELIVPHGTEKFLAGAHAAGILHEILQQTELNGREFHGFVVHGDLVGLRIQTHAVAAQQRIVVFLRGAPAQHGPDAQHEFPRVEGLDHVVVGAEFKAHDAVHVVAAGREHDDGDVFRASVLAEFAADGKTVHARQHDVQKNECGSAGSRQFQRGAAVGRFQRGVALAFEIEHQQIAYVLFVVHDENEAFAHDFPNIQQMKTVGSHFWGECHIFIKKRRLSHN